MPSTCIAERGSSGRPAAPGRHGQQGAVDPRPADEALEKGFFLQVEGASIDKQDHAANPCGQIGETVAFDAAVKAALTYQKHHPDTLVVVTADHGHTSQIVEAGVDHARRDGHAGHRRRRGHDDQLRDGRAYPASQQHTGTQVRIAAKGPQAANVLGVTDQTDLFFTMRRALGLN